MKRALIVGAGPVGCLSAIFLSRRGFQVDLYEARSDIRSFENISGRSINVICTVRSLDAFKEADLGEEFYAALEGIQLHSRYVHMPNGQFFTDPYDESGKTVLCASRLSVNKALLNATENCKAVNLHFEHKLIKCDTEIPTATFQVSCSDVITQTGDLLLGCDGAYSTVRNEMVKRRVNYSQSYLKHGYMEIRLPATKEGNHAFPSGYFHKWPRHEFFVVGHPNSDKSFTCVLVMSFTQHKKIVAGNEVITFFNDHFKDILRCLGEKRLRTIFLNQPLRPFVEIKCDPFHAGNTLLLGDAAHAVVPFYGQGLNCGLEDALILNNLMMENDNNISSVLTQFSKVRVTDAHAVADISRKQYDVLCFGTSTQRFKFRENFDGILNQLAPSLFKSEKEMMYFSRMGYSEVSKQLAKQEKLTNAAMLIVVSFFVVIFAMFANQFTIY